MYIYIYIYIYVYIYIYIYVYIYIYIYIGLIRSNPEDGMVAATLHPFLCSVFALTLDQTDGERCVSLWDVGGVRCADMVRERSFKPSRKSEAVSERDTVVWVKLGATRGTVGGEP